MEKYKILLISDDIRSSSGVAHMSRLISEGLLKKGNDIVHIAVAMKHSDKQWLETKEFGGTLKIIPSENFCDMKLINTIIDYEKPSAILLVTDPRFYMGLFERADEAMYRCPILYYTIWDHYEAETPEGPKRIAPDFNKPFYDVCSFLGCISTETLNAINSLGYSDKTEWIPHGLDGNIFYPEKDLDKIKQWKKQFLGNIDPKCIFFYNSRNAKRKQLLTTLDAFSRFVQKHNLKPEDSLFFMKTFIHDVEGPPLDSVINKLGLKEHTRIADGIFSPQDINKMYNISDCGILVSDSEGWGLMHTESSFVGKPIICNDTGGIRDQDKDCETKEPLSYIIKPICNTLIGSGQCHYIWEMHVSPEQVVEKLEQVYFTKLNNPEKLIELGEKARQHALKYFNKEQMIEKWDKAIQKVVKNFKENPPKSYSLTKI